jgi:hypothetical protein
MGRSQRDHRGGTEGRHQAGGMGRHACCTARIGSEEDPNAVLDTDFRVRGVDGLRIVDASLFLLLPASRHPHTPYPQPAGMVYRASYLHDKREAAGVLLADAT